MWQGMTDTSYYNLLNMLKQLEFARIKNLNIEHLDSVVSDIVLHHIEQSRNSPIDEETSMMHKEALRIMRTLSLEQRLIDKISALSE